MVKTRDVTENVQTVNLSNTETPVENVHLSFQKERQIYVKRSKNKKEILKSH